MQGIPGSEGDVIGEDTQVVRGYEKVQGRHGLAKGMGQEKNSWISEQRMNLQ